MTIIKKLELHLDDRGYLYEMLRTDDLCFKGFGQAYISTIYPDTVKGFHKHLIQSDYLVCIEGQIKLVLIDDRFPTLVINEFHMSLLDPTLIVVEPGIWHGWKCISKKPAIIVNFCTHLHDRSNPDEVKTDPHNNPWGYSWTSKDK